MGKKISQKQEADQNQDEDYAPCPAPSPAARTQTPRSKPIRHAVSVASPQSRTGRKRGTPQSPRSPPTAKKDRHAFRDMSVSESLPEEETPPRRLARLEEGRSPQR